jgi:hypothetical protein
VPSKARTVLDAWTRLLGRHDQPDLAHAEPDTLRYRVLDLPAKLATHARRKILSIPDTWPHSQQTRMTIASRIAR